MGIMGEESATVPATNLRICERKEKRRAWREDELEREREKTRYAQQARAARRRRRKKVKDRERPTSRRKGGKERGMFYLFVLHGGIGGLD